MFANFKLLERLDMTDEFVIDEAYADKQLYSDIDRHGEDVYDLELNHLALYHPLNE